MATAARHRRSRSIGQRANRSTVQRTHGAPVLWPNCGTDGTRGTRVSVIGLALFFLNIISPLRCCITSKSSCWWLHWPTLTGCGSGKGLFFSNITPSSFAKRGRWCHYWALGFCLDPITIDLHQNCRPRHDERCVQWGLRNDDRQNKSNAGLWNDMLSMMFQLSVARGREGKSFLHEDGSGWDEFLFFFFQSIYFNF